VVYKETEKVVKAEAEAIEATAGDAEAESKQPLRRLVGFTLFENKKDESMAHVEMIEFAPQPPVLSGAVYPAEGPLEVELGRRVERFGPVTGWSLATKTGGSMHVVLTTKKARYICVKPAMAYRKTFQTALDTAAITGELCRLLNPRQGKGATHDKFDTVVAAVNRAKVAKMSLTGHMRHIVLAGHTIIQQLRVIDSVVRASTGKTVEELPFVQGLRERMRQEFSTAAVKSENGAGGLAIKDEPVDAMDVDIDAREVRQRAADALIASRLAEEDKAAAQRLPGAARSKADVAIDIREIAGDYPIRLTTYKGVDGQEEIDEALLFGEYVEMLMDAGVKVTDEHLTTRVLKDFVVYDDEGMLSTIELLPLWDPLREGMDVGVSIFASGVVHEEDKDNEFASGFSLAAESADADGAGGSSEGEAGEDSPPRVYLGEIMGWHFEIGFDMLFVKVRTEYGWYKLAQPLPIYKDWMSVILKAGRICIKMLTMLTEAKRASQVSLNDAVKALAALPEDDPCFIAKSPEKVLKYLAVHGQMLLNQFKNYHVKEVVRSQLVHQLKESMLAVRHSKLYNVAQLQPGRHRARNPMQDRPSYRSKPMKATTTSLVYKVFESYFQTSDLKTGREAQDPPVQPKEEAPKIGATFKRDGQADGDAKEDDNNEDNVNEDGEEIGEAEAAEAEAAEEEEASKPLVDISRGKAIGKAQIKWVGSTKPAGKSQVHEAVELAGFEPLRAGGLLAYTSKAEDADALKLGLVQCLWATPGGQGRARVWQMCFGRDTALGTCASDCELFLVPETVELPLDSLKVFGVLHVQHRPPKWGLNHRDRALEEMLEVEQLAAKAREEGTQLPFFYRRTWEPTRACYAEPPPLMLGEFSDPGPKPTPKGTRAVSETSFSKDGIVYSEGDFMYLAASLFANPKEEERRIKALNIPKYAVKGRGKWKGGSNFGHPAFHVVRLVEIASVDEAGGKGGDKLRLKVQRCFRPEDVSDKLAYESQQKWEVYWSEKTAMVTDDDVCGKCHVVGEAQQHLAGRNDAVGVFVCTHTLELPSKKLSAPPKLSALDEAVVLGKVALAAAAQGGKKKRKVDKGKDKVADRMGKENVASNGGGADLPHKHNLKLKTLDIFAGCGGLTEGFHQAGVADTRWAIEYDSMAAEAFQKNFPEAAVMAENCNVVLRKVMERSGLLKHCSDSISEECIKQANELKQTVVEKLPVPGEVDLICGGPPCQGFSGMNRFNKRTWSKVQNEMILAYVSFADVFRPRYFLLENVRNFVTHNKSFQFQLAVRSLISMGYQVRFGVLNAGNFGVSQSRKRAFIWAAAPGEHLPDWPVPQHVFKSAQLRINFPDGRSFCAVNTERGCPLRAVTVRDTIGDLPFLVNGQTDEDFMNPGMDYGEAPVSWFQRQIRGDCVRLTEHICKELNPLNFERCKHVPKLTPGADWHALEEVVEADESKRDFIDPYTQRKQLLVPWCLSNETRFRHNEWRGLFGRLDIGGHFPTSITDPQPMGKVGQCFHPEQDRIISVRECARSQGFPDRFQFHGSIHNKHRQVGNAVPPPLANALGRQLRKALEKKMAA